MIDRHTVTWVNVTMIDLQLGSNLGGTVTSSNPGIADLEIRANLRIQKSGVLMYRTKWAKVIP